MEAAGLSQYTSLGRLKVCAAKAVERPRVMEKGVRKGRRARRRVAIVWWECGIRACATVCILEML